MNESFGLFKTLVCIELVNIDTSQQQHVIIRLGFCLVE